MTGAPFTVWLRRLCLFVVGIATAEFLVATIGVQIQRLPPSTDFASFYLAGAQTQDGLSPYDRDAIVSRGHALGFSHEQFPFLYPPPFALGMQTLSRMPYPRARQVWMLLAAFELLAGLWLVWLISRRQATALGLGERRYLWILFAAFVPAALNSTSVHNDVRAGSVGCLLFLLVSMFTYAFMDPPRRRDAWVAGGALAAAVLAKLAPVLLVPYAAWRGRKLAALLACGFLALTMLPALAHWGWAIVPDYIEHAIAPSLTHEVAPPMNQSLDAVLSRWLVQGDVVHAPLHLPLLKRVLSALGTLAILAFTARALRPRPRGAGLLPVEIGYIVLAMLLVMKLTWVQTLTAMLGVWPALMLAILRAAEREAAWARRAGVLACSGFWLSAAHVPILWGPLRHGAGIAVTGVHFYGVLLLWLVCGSVLRRAPGATQVP